MSEELFDVVFFGILQTGRDKETVMQNMAILFKTEAQKLAPYFAGGRKVIKGRINAGTAEKYKAALENVGLVVKLEACTDTSEIPAVSAHAKAAQTGQQSAAQEQTASADTGNMSLADVGDNVLEHPEEVIAQKIDDISNITMAEAGADVLEHPEEVTVQKIDDISSITMAEAGVDVLAHPAEVETQEIADISGLTMAEAGADVIKNPQPKEKVPVADTSGLSLD